MNNIIVKIICAFLCSMTTIYTIKIILNGKYKILKSRSILLTIIIATIIYFLYGIEYNIDSIILKIVLYIIAIKLILNIPIYQTIISTFIAMVLLMASDLLSSLIFINFITLSQMRGDNIYILLCNCCVCLITYLLINIPFIRKKISTFFTNLNNKSKLSTISVFVLSVLVVIYTLYNISINYSWSEKYIINVIIALSYFIIIIIFLKDRLEYNSLMNKYDSLFDYFTDLESSIEQSSLVNHEFKNQLAVIKGYIEANKIKDALNYLNDIVKELDTENKPEVSELKNIPGGGMQGLLYYKFISAQNKGIKVVFDINDLSKNKLKKLDYEKNKIISKVLGVYIDNAIEASYNTNNKIVTVEIYYLNNKVHFVISNKFKNNDIKLDKIAKKGYTTKGNGHGKGLYLINKMTTKLEWFKTETKIINNYFIQRVVIDIKKIH